MATVLSPNISGTKHGGTEPYNAIFGVGFPLHKPYIMLIFLMATVLFDPLDNMAGFASFHFHNNFPLFQLEETSMTSTVSCPAMQSFFRPCLRSKRSLSKQRQISRTLDFVAEGFLCGRRKNAATP